METDSDLILKTKRGELWAFDLLMRRYYQMVLGIARRFAGVHEDAIDLTQQVFVTAYEHLDRLAKPERFGSWLSSIARNEGKMWMRRRMVQPPLFPLDVEDADALSSGLTSASAEISRESARRKAVRDAIADALSILTAEQREAVKLHYLEGYDYRETADLLGVPVAAVRGRLDRARGVLRKELQEMTNTGGTWWNLNERDLAALRAAANCAISQSDQEKANFNAIYFTGDGRVVSSDCHRLFHYKSRSLDGVPHVLVHADLGRALRDSYSHARSGRLQIGDSQVVLQLEGGKEIIAPIVKLSYANWKKVVPQSREVTVTARTGDWLSALGMLVRQLRSGEGENADRLLVLLSPTEGRIILREGREPSPDRGISWEASVSFPASFESDGPDLMIAMNPCYMEQAISGLGLAADDQVELLAGTSLSPILTRPKGSETVFVVTMPMQRAMSKPSE